MATVNVDFSNTGNEIITVSYTDAQGTNLGPTPINPNQIVRRILPINFSFFFKLVRGREEKSAT